MNDVLAKLTVSTLITLIGICVVWFALLFVEHELETYHHVLWMCALKAAVYLVVHHNWKDEGK